MGHHEKVCIVCGTAYKYCGACEEYRLLEPWHESYHDKRCKDVFDILSRYVGKKNALAAKRDLEAVGLPETLRPGIQRTVDEIYEKAGSANVNISDEEFEERAMRDEPVADSEVNEEDLSEEEQDTVSEDSESEAEPVKKSRKKK